MIEKVGKGRILANGQKWTPTGEKVEGDSVTESAQWLSISQQIGGLQGLTGYGFGDEFKGVVPPTNVDRGEVDVELAKINDFKLDKLDTVQLGRKSDKTLRQKLKNASTTKPNGENI
jgi:hypothetical protein